LRTQLLRSSSVIAMVTVLGTAHVDAQTLAVLHAAQASANSVVAARYPNGMPPSLPGNKNGSNSVGMAGAQFRALQYVQRVNQALDMGMQAQQAARAAAAAMEPDVPDGLAPGGLDPVPNPVPAADDPTGLNTWEGADAPTQTTDSKGVQVTVHQTESRAILSWQTFNVGQKTSLVFDQSQNGTDQQSWVVLNRVVGQLDPSTGLRNPLLEPAPSQILGSIKAPGTVLILNQNGVIFGGTSQVNTGSLIATSLEIGRAVDPNTGPLSIKQRNDEFLTFGFLGFADQASTDQQPGAFTFSAQEYTDSAGNVQFDPLLEGAINVQAGAQVTSANQGYILLAGPKVINSGTLTASQGQVSLQSGRDLRLVRSTGAPDSATPDVRGFALTSSQPSGCQATSQCDYVENTAEGIINSSEGYISLGATLDGAVIEQGVLAASTSVSRNGFIQLTGADIQIAQNATLAITPLDSKETIPQDPTSLQDFKPSRISIGTEFSRIEIDQNAMLYAPSGNVDIGAAAGPVGSNDSANPGDSRIFVDSGAVIDVAGLTDVLIPASRNSILIDPVKGNELRDDPNYRNSFLNGAALLVDPRLSGVNENGVAWVGSPLIEAKSFAEQVGVTVQELMTRGGNVSLGVESYAPGTNVALAPDITIKTGATIDMSGGWVTYEGGFVQTSQLISAGGGLVDVGRADINGDYVGLYGGFTETQARWGVSQSWGSLLLQGGHYESTYTEGRDAGSLTLKGSTVVLDGTVIGNAYAGPRQITDAAIGTAISAIYGDDRHLQGAPSQLPSGGVLIVQALSSNASGTETLIGGGDIELVSQANYHPVDPSLGYGQSVSIDANGNLVVPVRDPNSLLPAERQDTISFSADALSSMGLSAVSLMTSGKLTVDSDANLTLAAGGAFEALAGRTTTIDGTITVPSGAIQIQTINAGVGSVFFPDTPGPGSFDIVVNGTLSAKGRWVNDFGATSDEMQGSAYTNGGSVVLIGAPRQAEYVETATVDDTQNGTAPTTNVDISGSILLNQDSLIDVSAGGYVGEKGALKLNAQGGNVSLIEQTAYFQLGNDTANGVVAGGFSAFRVTTNYIVEVQTVEVNPSEVTARVTLDGTIRADGFSGGGTFTLFTPEISFGDGTATTGTEMPLDFFSKSGFANFNITSYKTDLEANTFTNGLGGYNALLATQVLTVGDGQTLLLSQSMFNPVLDTDQQAALRNLETGGDVYTVLTPSVPTDAWDQRAVNLTLGGLIELDVARGGTILGAAGTSLTVSQLYNQGTIRLPGGTIIQAEVLPQLYTQTNTLAIHSLSDVFSVLPDGTINEGDPSKYNSSILNGDLAAQYPMYLLGNLNQTDGIVLAAGSVTDLSGESIVNPRATGIAPGGSFRDGRVIAGGTLETVSGLTTANTLFTTPIGTSDYVALNPTTVVAADTLTADPGSQINLAGASDTFDRLGSNGKYVPTPEWSDAGTLSLGNGGTLTGAIIDAHGGAPEALGGTLIVLDPVLYQNDPGTPTRDAISASMVETSGFDTFVAEGSLNSSGDVTLSLGRGFFLVSRPYDGQANLADPATRDTFAPVVRAGGALEIDAPYIRFASSIQNVSTPLAGTPGTGSAIFRANEIDISGALLFDQSVANVELDALGDVRLSGVEPWQQVFNQGAETVPNSLLGQLAVNGNLSITAGQVYPTTGSTFYVTSSAADGTITFARSGEETPATPYSAGGNLLVQAANIVQGGIVRVPIGSLTIGNSNPFTIDNNGTPVTFAPGTTSLDVTAGSITSVSADGMAIPYGTTTDQIEWFFAATGADELTAPPKAVLTMGGANVTVDSGSTVDISGGGDLYAYEFISGTGGSHDVLDRFNNDAFSSGNGFQYPDGRQVYAIVPSISNTQAAAYDPIYSSDYNDLYSASAAGKQVYLTNVPGLAAGWYTLLPAKYATLPGGIRIVENTGATNIIPGQSTTLVDGSYLVSGYYGTAGTGDRESELRSFTVQTQSVFNRYSNIALTSANLKFAALAAHNGQVVPQLPIDAGRLVLAPSDALTIDTTLTTSPGKGGRGAEVDISGSTFDIVSTAPVNGPQGAIVLTADELTNLNAASLLIGGIRTDNSDGTTSLDVTASSILVENDAAHPLSGPEVVLAVDGSGAGIKLADGATILAKGNVTDTRSGDYIIDGSLDNMTGQGAVLRVSAGPERQITRVNVDTGTTAGTLSVGAADLEGPSVLLDSSGDLTVSSNATIKTDALALGAGQVSFTNSGDDLPGLVITSALQALFSQAADLIIRTPGTISFSSGSYNFNNLTLDTPGLALLDGNSVTLDADKLTLANSQLAAGACGSSGAPSCGSGNLTINATEIDFANGTLQTYGFGGRETLAATTGIFAEGSATFDAGSGELDLQSPFIGDRALALAPGESAAIPDLSFVSTGAVLISNPGGAPAGTFDGTPGATLSISGDSVTISGTTLRATAGTLDILAAHGVTVGSGAVLSTPGYAKNFGDSADPYIVYAPGGLLHLTAVDGNIDLQSGSLLSVGGDIGTAGTLELSAPQGNVAFDGTLDAQAPGGGASFVLDQKGAFSLANFGSRFGNQFDGTIAIRTATGDLVLASGDTLKGQNVLLTADGGSVDISGTIDVSGVNGGTVNLFGLDGVTLESGSVIDAHAVGYGLHDTRQAHGGNVEIGTDGNGIITVDSGATIDVSALQKGDRLVPILRNGKTYYIFAPADVGGSVEFRAPVIDGSDGETVNVFYDGTIDGASQIVLQGFERFDLAKIAADPDFVGVTINDAGQAVLDVGAVAGTGQSNFLADYGNGTLVQFVQDFDISAANGQLGSLTSSAVFHERPGMELDYSGDIVLSSNWNLGAGVVDVAGAVAAGLMAQLPTVDGKYYVLPGKEAEVFQDFTTLTYRTDHGSVDGEPGVLTIRAGGTLDIKGSITDGFFQFRDQTDPDYLNEVLGGGNKLYTPYLLTGCIGGLCNAVGAWGMGGQLPNSYVRIGIDLGSILENPAPYSAEANSPAAVGSLAGGTGDPLGSAQLFPLLTNPDGTTRAVQSTSYQLVGGADLTGSAIGTPSVDPMRTRPGAAGGLIIEGTNSYTYAGSKTDSSSAFGTDLLMAIGNQYVSPDAWYQSFVDANPTLNEGSFTYISFQNAPSSVVDFLINQAATFFAPDQYQLIVQGRQITGITTSLKLASEFIANVYSANFSSLVGDYKPPKPQVITTPTTAQTRTLVRSGTGNIGLAAAGNIDLTNGAPVYRDLDGNITSPENGGLQVGGTAVYTAGHLVDPTPRTIVDALTGLTFDVDPGGFASTQDVFAHPLTVPYLYGAGGDSSATGVGLSGVLIANPVYADGGGSISLSAGQDVLGRRDVWQQVRIAENYYTFITAGLETWIGPPDQMWRSGAIGNASDVRINPQLFQEGIGALAGGNITINAGRDVSDISIVDDTTLTTAAIQASGSAASTLGLLVFGGGNVVVNAGRDLLGGRLDVGSGSAWIDAGRDIVSAGLIQIDGVLHQTQEDELRIRLSDAFISIEAGRNVDIQGIAALGVSGLDPVTNLDARGFYSDIAGVSVLANGSVTVENTGADVVTENDPATDLTTSAVYPGTFEATALTGNLTINTNSSAGASAVILYPSPTGELQLISGANISQTEIAQEDGDPGLLPGLFSVFSATSAGVTSGRTFLFPGVLPSTTEVQRQALHNRNATHAGDAVPNRIYAGGDILDMIISVAKQTRIGAGLDIVNMMFFGQNLATSDITRIVAGRDITATTTLVEPLIGLQNGETFGPPEAAVQGNTFVIGGPGSFFLEAGRDAGPFLNSAVTNGFETQGTQIGPTGEEVWGGGILSVGNEWNPWLSAKGSDLYVEFGVGKGQDFDALRDYYLDPANLPNLNGDLFVQVKNSAGNPVPDRNQPIYAPILINWLQKNQSQVLESLYGTTTITFQQAYDAFKTLPELVQRVFMLGNVYFNELIQTSIPSGPSFKQYSRGYQAVNLLFPAALGYTANDLSGGSNGANQTVETGNLDLRLATIQTSRGGNIYILGPGGRLLAGSTVRTSEQAARRTYDGGRLFAGNIQNSPIAAAIAEIPLGYEGILTLRGGSIYTFTDTDFLLNQSRLFTEAGGNIAMWSSNGDLNAGQGPKTSANFPPVVVQVDEDLFSQVNSVGGVSGAGIAAFEPAPGVTPPDVFLIAPRGTVDAGDAGVRVAGDLFIAALAVANAENFSVGGAAFGIPGAAAVDVAATTSASAASAAATQAAQNFVGAKNNEGAPSIITVELLGYDSENPDDEKRKKKK
jgi:filamentous hemagglutinin family protein